MHGSEDRWFDIRFAILGECDYEQEMKLFWEENAETINSRS